MQHRMILFCPKSVVHHTTSFQPKWLRNIYTSHALYVLMALDCLLQIGHFLTLLAHEKHATMWPQGVNTESMISSKQMLHSSSALCFLCGGSSSSADTGGRRWSHSIKSHNPSPGSVRLVTLPHNSATEGFYSRQISLCTRIVRPTKDYGVSGTTHEQ